MDPFRLRPPAPTGCPYHIYFSWTYRGPKSKSWKPKIPDPGHFPEREPLFNASIDLHYTIEIARVA